LMNAIGKSDVFVEKLLRLWTPFEKWW
jgi:hypothetical protein